MRVDLLDDIALGGLGLDAHELAEFLEKRNCQFGELQDINQQKSFVTTDRLVLKVRLDGCFVDFDFHFSPLGLGVAVVILVLHLCLARRSGLLGSVSHVSNRKDGILELANETTGFLIDGVDIGFCEV